MDGNKGEVVVNPDGDTIIEYQERQLRHERYESRVLRLSHLPAETVDGCRITVKANIEFLEEVAVALDHGAEGIGLYRTEFLFLRAKEPPGEEMFEDYRQVAEIIAPAPVTIRTFCPRRCQGPPFTPGISHTRARIRIRPDRPGDEGSAAPRRL